MKAKLLKQIRKRYQIVLYECNYVILDKLKKVAISKHFDYSLCVVDLICMQLSCKQLSDYYSKKLLRSNRKLYHKAVN